MNWTAAKKSESVYGRFLMVTCDVKHRLRYAHCRHLCKQSSGANKSRPPVRPRTFIAKCMRSAWSAWAPFALVTANAERCAWGDSALPCAGGSIENFNHLPAT